MRLFDPATRFFYLAWVLVAIVSIVLHELAHGWVALRHGDPTPRLQNRLTGNPLVHMGGYSLAVLAVLGMAWGAMPVDPTRMRGKYAEAAVAVAGPAMNLLIAIVCLTGLGVLIGTVGAPQAQWQENGYLLLRVGGIANLVLMVFNLMPVPPLDGSHIAANFSRGYRDFVSDPSKQGILFFGFPAAFMLSWMFWEVAYSITGWYVGVLVGIFA